jgi:hypothetical protein
MGYYGAIFTTKCKELGMPTIDYPSGKRELIALPKPPPAYHIVPKQRIILSKLPVSTPQKAFSMS